MQELFNIYLNIKPTAYQEQEVKGSKVVVFSNIISVGGVKEISAQLVQVILKVPITKETRPSTPNFLLKLPKIDLSSPLEVYLSENSQESNQQEESKVLPYKSTEPLQWDSLYTNYRHFNLATQPTIQINKKPTVMTPKKLKLNIEYIGSKIKKRYKHDLTSSPKKNNKIT